MLKKLNTQYPVVEVTVTITGDITVVLQSSRVGWLLSAAYNEEGTIVKLTEEQEYEAISLAEKGYDETGR
jgi:energy-converting hydrogenase Eha subunit C